ncbi:MAG: hypothetical protein LBE79_00330 [Tannerella sp.]|jgi:hypothetical protein|nr:hypothetical protein [Tannerella sp.]
MKNQERKSDNQVMFFDLVQKELPTNHTLVDVISDLLGISSDAAYRRIRGEKLIDLEEAIHLSRHFQISIDSLASITPKDTLQCHYSPLDFNDPNCFSAFFQTWLSTIKSHKSLPGSEIKTLVSDIPLFNYFPCKDLMLFILFSWSKNVYCFSRSFDEFIKSVEKDKLIKYHEEIVHNFQQIPSTEIWTANTIEKFLYLLNFHYETGSFDDKNMPLLLCEQLLEMIEKLQNYTEYGKKNPQETNYQLYIYDFAIDNTMTILRHNKKTKFVIKLYTLNNIMISDESFCQEMGRWINNIIDQSTLISGGSSKERYKFFHNQRNKIQMFMQLCFERS